MIGVFAFQGDIAEHKHALETLGIPTKDVRSIEDLKKTQALIIPGGESTVIGKFLSETGMDTYLTDRVRNEHFPVLGTCAGAIILSQLKLMDISIKRNAYGPQAESFEEKITINLDQAYHMNAVFIRAPIIEDIGSNVTVLAEHQGHPVCVQQGKLIAATFHAEINGEKPVLHQYFASMINN